MHVRKKIFRVTGIIAVIFYLSVAGFSAAVKNDPQNEKPPPPADKSAAGNSCLECHKNLSGKLKSVTIEWEASVHAVKNNNCNACHGGNPAINDARLSKSKNYNFMGRPDKRNIPEFCGRDECHSTACMQFKKSPHYNSVKKTGEPSCVSCHGKHNIQRSSINIISDNNCSSCHSVEYSREIISSIFNIENSFDSIRKKMEYLDQKKLDIKDANERFNKSRQLYRQMIHVFSSAEMQFTKKILELELESLDKDLSAKMNIIKRMDFIYIFLVGFCFCTISLLAIYLIWIISRRNK